MFAIAFFIILALLAQTLVRLCILVYIRDTEWFVELNEKKRNDNEIEGGCVCNGSKEGCCIGHITDGSGQTVGVRWWLFEHHLSVN